MKTDNAWAKWRWLLAAVAVFLGTCAEALAWVNGSTTINGIRYTLYSNGEASVAGGGDSTLFIPSNIAFSNDIYLVKNILEDSFGHGIFESRNFESVTIMANLEGDWYSGRISPLAVKTSPFQSARMENLALGDNLTKIGDYLFYCTDIRTPVTIPDSVKSIGTNAFSGNGWLPGLVIGSGVNHMDSGAFSDCTNLESVVIRNGATCIGTAAFSGCGRLTDVSIPDSVETIGASAFRNCRGLTNIAIPDSVQSIEGGAFGNCTNLTDVSIGNGVIQIGGSAFYECNLTELTIPESVTQIGASAFYGCHLKDLTIPESVTHIGARAFGACGLKNVTVLGNVADDYGTGLYQETPFFGCSVNTLTLGGKMTRIGANMFSGLSSLADLTIPDAVTDIGSNAFNSCASLTNVVIGRGVERIGWGAFYGCNRLNAVHIHDLAAWCRISFEDVSANPLHFARHLYLGDKEISGCLVIPDGVEAIGRYAFENCTRLENVVIPDSVKSIGEYAFSTSGLRRVTIPFNVVDVGSNAFQKCPNLEHVVIMNPATVIGYGAFAGCTRLAVLYAPGEWEGTYQLLPAELPLDCKVVYGLHREEVDGVPWVYLTSNGEARVVAFPETATGSLAVPAVLGGCPVSTLAEYACHARPGLTSVTIPGSVTNIGRYAFAGCSGLMKITIPDSATGIGAYAFEGCSNLANVTIPDSVTSIDSYAFQSCIGLTNLTIGNGVTDIGYGAFYNCPGLTNLVIPDSVTRIGAYAFEGCSNLTSVTIPDSVTSIDSYAFRSCIGLTNLTIGDGVTDIGYGAFYNCPGLTNLVIPDSVTRIGADAFSGCTGLAVLEVPGTWRRTEILKDTGVPDECQITYREILVEWSYSISNGVATVTGASPAMGDLAIPSTLDGYPVKCIGEGAFYGCSNLTSMAIPDSVTDIDRWAFRTCICMTNLAIGHGVTDIGYGAFYNCRELTNLVIPDSVTWIGEEAFSFCIGLTDLTIGNSVTHLGNSAFSACYSLSHLAIPESVTWVGNYAFSDCSNLENITVPASVTWVGYHAFAGCTGLNAVCIRDLAAWCSISFGDVSANPLCYAGHLYLDDKEVSGSLVIPDGVEVIGSYAFENCTRLENVVIPDSVTSIGRYAFSDCNGVASVTIGNGVMAIWDGAFYGCSGLTEITIPDSVGRIGEDAFGGCSALATLYVPASWKGTDMLADAAVPEGCTIVYVSNPKSQSLDWAPLGTGHVSGDRVKLSATAGGGGDVQFEVLSGPGMLEANTLTFTGMGTVTVRAYQPGDEDWLPVEETREAIVAATAADGRRVYADLAANYPGGWEDGTNGGEGFGAWRFDVRDGSGNGWAGGGIWDPSANGFAGTWEGKTKAFGLIGKGDGFSIRTSRSFLRALAPGDSFSLEMAVNWDSNMEGSEKGFALTAGEEDVIVVNHGSYPGNISVNGNASYDAINVYGLHPVTWTFTVVDTNTLQFTATGRDDPANVATGTLKVVTSAIDGFRLQSAGQYALDENAWEGDCRQSYYDDFRLFLSEGGETPPPVEVPQAWLEEKAQEILIAAGGDYDAAANAPAANGLPVWKCYVAGLEPTDADAEFKVKSISFENGEPVVKWTPDLDEDRAYTVQGKPAMADAWGVTNASSRFFRVLVEMPK